MGRADVREAVDYGLVGSRHVRTLISAMGQLGCPVDRSHFLVMRCDAAVGGGFAPGHGVILCHNRLHTRQEVLNAMTHELIHAYDHCRAGARPWGPEPAAEADGAGPSSSAVTPAAAAAAAKPCVTGSDAGSAVAGAAEAGREATATAGAAGAGTEATAAEAVAAQSATAAAGAAAALWPFAAAASTSGGGGSGGGGGGGCGGGGGLDWSNVHHHACTEIRAANLSGDCSLFQELMRGNLPLLPSGWGAQQRACVARRAALSVAMNPAVVAAATVEAAGAAAAAASAAAAAGTTAGDGREATGTGEGAPGRSEEGAAAAEEVAAAAAQEAAAARRAAAVVVQMMDVCLSDTAPFDVDEGVARP